MSFLGKNRGGGQNRRTVLDPLSYISTTRSPSKPLHLSIIVYSTTFIECHTHTFPVKTVLVWTSSLSLKIEIAEKSYHSHTYEKINKC